GLTASPGGFVASSKRTNTHIASSNAAPNRQVRATCGNICWRPRERMSHAPMLSAIIIVMIISIVFVGNVVILAITFYDCGRNGQWRPNYDRDLCPRQGRMGAVYGLVPADPELGS